MARHKLIIVGAGLIGSTLGKMYEDKYEVVMQDMVAHYRIADYEVMHVCFPYSKHFVKEVIRYIGIFNPKMVIIHSTILPKTTRRIFEKTNTPIAFSPVIGDHNCMAESLKIFTKMVASIDTATAQKASKHLKEAGIKTKVFDDLEGLELGKPALTSHFGLNIAYMQTLERMCKEVGANPETYRKMQKIYNEGYNKFRPQVRLPILTSGVIGGTCVMQNIKKLLSMFKSDLLRAVQKSNRRKAKDDKCDCNRA